MPGHKCLLQIGYLYTNMLQKDKEIQGMCRTIKTIESHMDMVVCTTAEMKEVATMDNANCGILSEHALLSWPSM